MRIVLLVNRDIESNFALNLLMPEIHQSTVGIFLSGRVGSSRTVLARMLGQLAFIEQDLFNDLVFPLVDQPDQGNGRFVGFEELQRRFGIPVHTLATLKDPAVLQQLRDLRADLDRLFRSAVSSISTRVCCRTTEVCSRPSEPCCTATPRSAAPCTGSTVPAST